VELGGVDGELDAAAGGDRGAIWWDAIAAHLAADIDRPTTVETIATRYLHFVDVYLAARPA
jgi:hypothetical protein